MEQGCYSMSELKKDIISVADLLTTKSLTIPDYQRPYRWTLKNVVQLFHDIDMHISKTSYRLGTVVFHYDEEKNQRNIVDGQQRTLTLLLAVWAIIEKRLSKIDRGLLKEQVQRLSSPVEHLLNDQTFSSDISKANLRANFLEIKRIVGRPDFTEAHIDFLLNKCQVVTFTLENVSEAFQFFDSQNARGKDLSPHDLLKAYHLREFGIPEQHLKAQSVADWESLKSKTLEKLFADYLYRIRRWARGERALYFGKDQVDVFKGVNLYMGDAFPYTTSLKIAHHYTDEFNQQYQRKVDGQYQKYPFGLDQPIVNGRRFFEMVAHYQKQIEALISNEYESSDAFLGVQLSEDAHKILQTLNSSALYKNKRRTGDIYIRELFDCALIFYWDKFGVTDLSRAIEKLFIWAYSLRIQRQVLQLSSVDKYVVEESNVFKLISQAIHPSQLMALRLPMLNDELNRNNSGKNRGNKNQSAVSAKVYDPLVILFEGMGYYE